MKTTWAYYKNRYPRLLKDLKSNNFSLSVLSAGFDWTDAVSRITEGFRGFSQDVPALDELREIVEEAREQGSAAADMQFKQIYSDSKPGEKFYAPCGGGMIVLDIDGRSRLGRLLTKASKEIDGFSFWRRHKGGHILSIRDMHSCQERDVDVVAAKAAFDVFQKRLGVVGHVEEYYD